MKTLIQYLFEATVNTAELEKNLTFEETDLDGILDILDTDEYNHFEDLVGQRVTKDDVRSGVFLLKHSTHFKIMYEGTLLGIFSVCLPENFKDSIRNERVYDLREFSNKRHLRLLFYPFIDAAVNGEPSDLIDKNDYEGVIEKINKNQENYADYVRQCNEANDELIDRIMSITGFVVIWQLSKDAKKKIDVNQIALLKIFFQKLTKLIKNTGAKYIMAQGKDEHVTNAYIKLGGFNSTEKLFKKYAADYNRINRDFISGTVIKRI